MIKDCIYKNGHKNLHCTKIWLIVFAGMPIIATSGPSANVVGIPMGPELKMDPYFIESQHTTSRNITVYTGQTAFMECPMSLKHN